MGKVPFRRVLGSQQEKYARFARNSIWGRSISIMTSSCWDSQLTLILCWMHLCWKGDPKWLNRLNLTIVMNTAKLPIIQLYTNIRWKRILSRIPHQFGTNLASIDLLTGRLISISCWIMRRRMWTGGSKRKGQCRCQEEGLDWRGSQRRADSMRGENLKCNLGTELRGEIGQPIGLVDLESRTQGSLWESWRKKRKGRDWTWTRYIDRLVCTVENDISFLQEKHDHSIPYLLIE